MSYYHFSKLCYLVAFIFLVALTVTAYRTFVSVGEHIVTFRLYTTMALAGVVVGSVLGLMKRNDKYSDMDMWRKFPLKHLVRKDED